MTKKLTAIVEAGHIYVVELPKPLHFMSAQIGISISEALEPYISISKWLFIDALLKFVKIRVRLKSSVMLKSLL